MSLVPLILSALVWLGYDQAKGGFQFEESLLWIKPLNVLNRSRRRRGRTQFQANRVRDQRGQSNMRTIELPSPLAPGPLYGMS